MKRLLKRPVAALLALLARGVIHRYSPRVIMVTGSVGKTSTKDAVAAVLAESFFVGKSEKSYNSEFGVPFAVLGVDNPWTNPLKWVRVFKTALGLLLLPNHYPNMLVLEVGADRPGDLARILRIATPEMVIVTRLPEVPVHVEAYPSPEAVREEEFSPAYALSPGAALIIAADDAHALRMAARLPARLITYGSLPEATVSLSHMRAREEDGMLVGMQADIALSGETLPLFVKGSIGETQLLSAAAAVAAGFAFGVSFPLSVAALGKAVPPPGRGRLLSGKHGTYLIDESYNSSPAAIEVALENLKKTPCTGRRIAVLGDMLELGRYSVTEHERIGKVVARTADMVFGVGVRSRHMVEAARSAGMGEEYTFSLESVRVAADMLPDLVRAGDVVLIKGSQSMRTERIVEALLADQADAAQLVRQEAEWKRIA